MPRTMGEWAFMPSVEGRGRRMAYRRGIRAARDNRRPGVRILYDLSKSELRQVGGVVKWGSGAGYWTPANAEVTGS